MAGRMPSTEETATFASLLGAVRLQVRDGRLARVELLTDAGEGCGQDGRGASAGMRAFLEALGAYFRGADVELPDAALDLSGLSEFERRVLGEVRRVRLGRLVTYGELASRVGRPGAARAVGQALGRNPLPVFIPCHRVVAAGGRLGGFGAGPRWKRDLLAHEGWTISEGKVVGKRRTDDAKVCVYAGSFDPLTNGHMYMIEKGAELFDRLIVAVGVNPNKKYSFIVADRLAMLRECTQQFSNVEVDSFEGQFLVHYAGAKGAGYILRGVRSEEDYRFEHAMRNVNEDLEPGITTLFLIPPREICEVSSSFVKGLVGFEGWQDVVRPYVPQPVYERLLKAKLRWPDQSAGAEERSD